MKKTKQILAIIGVVLLVALYVSTLAVSYTHLDVYKRQPVNPITLEASSL